MNTTTANPTQPVSEQTDSHRIEGLPSPSELPAADVVIFDGKCNFCIQQVRHLKRLDGKDRLAFVSLHDPWVQQHYPDLTHDQMMEQIYVVPNRESGKGDQRHGGAAAIRYLSTRLPKLWLAAPFLHIPFTLPLWQFGYRTVANRRYKIAGKNGDGCDPDGTCDLHFRK